MTKDLRKDLSKLLTRFTIEGGSTSVEITDPAVGGFNSLRMVAKVRVFKGEIYVNVYRGYWYKPSDETKVPSVADAVSLILSTRKETSSGKDVQKAEGAKAS